MEQVREGLELSFENERCRSKVMLRLRTGESVVTVSVEELVYRLIVVNNN